MYNKDYFVSLPWVAVDLRADQLFSVFKSTQNQNNDFFQSLSKCPILGKDANTPQHLHAN